MYPEVEQYLAAVKVAKAKRDAEFKKLSEERAEVRSLYTSYSRRDAASDEIWRKQNAAALLYKTEVREAWKTLRTSQDPMVLYIEKHCYEYPDHADKILEILPADFAAMRKLAHSEGWCEVFERFAAGAIRQRLLTDDRTPARRKLEKHLLHEHGGRSIEVLEPLIQGLITEEIAKARKAWTAEQKSKAAPTTA